MCKEKIDFVITWVDGNDKNWIKERALYLGEFGDKRNVRYRDWDLLKYWFRGVEKFAPWVNKIHFVTYGHLPEWLNINHPNLNIVKHEDFIPKQYLPTFNSHTIELNFHRIKGLSEKFVYFNDDMYLINKSNPEDFFRNNLPCDAAVLGCICPQDDVVSNVIFNNVVILNKYFVKTDLTIKKWNYVLNLKYGKHLIRTLLLYPFGKFTGFYDFHLAIPFMKKTFEEVWQLEKKVLDTTCNNKFRTVHDVSPWVFRYWQLAKCDFVPHKVLGKYFAIGDRHSIDYILKQKNKIICCNDTEENIDFSQNQQNLYSAFNTILPAKSKFEK